MASPGALKDLFDAAASLFEENRPLLPMYLHLILSALFPIYIGAYASLSRPSSAAEPLKDAKEDASKDDNDDDEEDEETVQKMEGLSPQDAIVFPITAGIVLAGLYFAIKTYGADLINLILGVYFSLIGTYSVSRLINDTWTTVESFVSPTFYRANGQIWKVHHFERKAIALGKQENQRFTRSSPLAGPFGRLPLPTPLRGLTWSLRDLTKQKFIVKGYAHNIFDFQALLTRHNVLSMLMGIGAIAYSIFVAKPWWLTNLQGFAVCYGALQLMSPTTFATGTLILSGLFVYDVWAVFFTPLMVTVAKNLDVPIKLVFPRPEEPSADPGKPPVRSYSMLGLGDIVLPGLMIALALRFDLYMFYVQKQKRVNKPSVDPKGSTIVEVEKAPYATATGHWGDRFWTMGAASLPEARLLPTYLTTTFPKPYFLATVVGYTIGMMATLVFMSIFQHAQPALLYLVPAVLFSLWGTGLARGELKYLWNFSEALTNEDEENSKAESSCENDPTPEAGSYLSRLCDLFGGDTETKPAKASEQSKAASLGDKDKHKQASSIDSERDVILAFSIAFHNARKGRGKPPASKSLNRSNVPHQTTYENKTKHGSSDSISDDGVLVSSADLDVVNNVTRRAG